MKNRMLLPAAMLALLFAGACGDTESAVDSPDGEFDVAFADGKADSVFGTCEAEKLLEVLNTPETDVDALKASGVHTRAAKNIIKQRDGDDGQAGTGDDFIFENLTQVDDVSYVGKVAMNQLAASVAELCVIVPSNAEVIFSPQDYDSSHLARVAVLIDGAAESVDIAMYSYRDGGIASALDRAIARGVSVRMIFEKANKDKSNPAGTASARLEDQGVDVRYINKIMHHKFAIIDGPREALSATAQTDMGVLLSGSGNWSNSAGTRYDENTVFLFGNAEMNLRFQREFNHLWANSRDFEWNTSLDYFESDSITEDMITDDPSVDAVFTSSNFRTSVSSRYGNTFSVIRGMNTVADKLVELINASETSIYLASGHLRSRPISEALMAKKAANPSMDIRIYLDGQEYISESTDSRQEDKLEDCLVAAGTSESKTQSCYDKGYYFSLPVHEAGIDLRFKHYSYRWHYSYAPQMHHKYMIFDERIVATGSYNLSDNAEHNTMENVMIFDASAHGSLVESYINNFDTMWVTGEAEGHFEKLMDEIENGTGDRVSIVYESMALTWSQVRDVKSALNSACSDINTTDFRRSPERHFTCTRR